MFAKICEISKMYAWFISRRLLAFNFFEDVVATEKLIAKYKWNVKRCAPIRAENVAVKLVKFYVKI